MTGESIVRVDPVGVDFLLEPGQSLMAAARQQGYRWPTACHGDAICTLCHVTIVDGGEHALSPSTVELERLVSVGLDPQRSRLACQLLVNGPMTVHKRGVARRKHAVEPSAVDGTTVA